MTYFPGTPVGAQVIIHILKDLFFLSSGYLGVLTVAPDGKVYRGTGDINSPGRAYLFCYNPATNIITNLGRPDAAARVITDLTSHNSGKIYGGLYGSTAGDFFVYNPSANTTTILGDAIPGVVWHLTLHESEKIYGASDGEQWLFVYDPSVAWNPGNGPQNNPYWLGNLPWLGRIKEFEAGKDGKLYGGDSLSTFFSYDPRLCWVPGEADTNNPRMYHNGIPGETDILSLTVGDDGFIYGGTQPNAHLFVFVARPIDYS